MAGESSPKESGMSGAITKVVGAVFGAIIAPIVVAVGIKAIAPSPDKNNPPAVDVTPDKGKDGGAEARSI